MISEIKCIHYGSDKYRPWKFKPIKDMGGYHIGSKPSAGGLWSSPVDSKHSWYDWCMVQDWGLEDLNTSFEFTFKGRLLVIESRKDLAVFRTEPWYPGDPIHKLFFEPLLEKYDAIHLTEEGEYATKEMSLYGAPSLYGWDCETVLVLNKECIYINEEVQNEKEVKMVQA